MTLDERIKQFRRRWKRPIEWDDERSILVKMIFDLIDEREILLGELQVLLAAGADDWNDALNTKPEEPGLYICVMLYPSPHVNIVQYLDHCGFVDHVAAWKPLPDIPDYVKQWLLDMVHGKEDIGERSGVSEEPA